MRISDGHFLDAQQPGLKWHADTTNLESLGIEKLFGSYTIEKIELYLRGESKSDYISSLADADLN